MNPSAKNKILIWSVVLLMIVNVAVLIALILSHHKPVDHRGTPADYLIKELGLNAEQQKRLKGLADQHHQQAETIMVKIKDARDSLFGLLQQPTISDSTKNAAADNVAKNLEQLDLLTFDHFKQVRAICTPDQQKKFDKIIQDVLRMIAEGAPQGHRPPPPRGFEHNRRPPEEDRMPPPNH